MSKTRLNTWGGLALLTSTCVTPAFAQEVLPPEQIPSTRDEILRLVDQALPSMIGKDNAALVEQLLSARLGSPLRKNLNIDQSTSRLFGRQKPDFDPDCATDTTPSGDPSPDPCTATTGEAEGQGAYTEFSWSKNLGYGEVKFLNRLADGSSKAPQPVKLTDKEAYAKAVDFLVTTMGVPKEEVPVLPARAPLPVSTLAVGATDEATREQMVVPIMKMVQIPRALIVNLKDPASGRTLPYVSATGEAYVLMDDSGIRQSSVRRWMEMEASSRVNPKYAKTRDELVEEIADAILADNASPIRSLGVKFEIQAYDPVRSAASGAVIATMLPAVQISYSVVPRDPSEEEQAKLGPDTAGQTLAFSLVHLEEAPAASSWDTSSDD